MSSYLICKIIIDIRSVGNSSSLPLSSFLPRHCPLSNKFPLNKLCQRHHAPPPISFIVLEQFSGNRLCQQLIEGADRMGEYRDDDEQFKSEPESGVANGGDADEAMVEH